MTYTVTGLAREDFADLFTLDDAKLAERGARRVIAEADAGWPCRIALRDARKGDRMILLHHVSHDVATPYRSAYAIYVGENSQEAEPYVDAVPPVLAGRPIAFRGFDEAGNLRAATLSPPGKADAGIRELLLRPEVSYIHAHNAAHGCFAARIDRSGGAS